MLIKSGVSNSWNGELNLNWRGSGGIWSNGESSIIGILIWWSEIGRWRLFVSGHILPIGRSTFHWSLLRCGLRITHYSLSWRNSATSIQLLSFLLRSILDYIAVLLSVRLRIWHFRSKTELGAWISAEEWVFLVKAGFGLIEQNSLIKPQHLWMTLHCHWDICQIIFHFIWRNNLRFVISIEWKVACFIISKHILSFDYLIFITKTLFRIGWLVPCNF